VARADPEQAIKEAVAEAIRPTWAETLRAKKGIASLVEGGEPTSFGDIQMVLIRADGLGDVVPGQQKLHLRSTEVDELARVATRDHPLLAYIRLAWAATDALVDLVSQGLIVAATSNAPQGAVGEQVRVSYDTPGLRSGVQICLPIPPLVSSYRLAPRLTANEVPWYLFEPDLFTEDLAELELDGRTKRCICEALGAYRSGLFLACANLLGAASEGAWYAAGERLRDLDRKLSNALDGENTRQVISRIHEVLRGQGNLATTASGLRSTADLLIRLRNYGVHPRSAEADPLERYFTDASAAVLIMETHAYLRRLAGAVTDRLA